MKIAYILPSLDSKAPVFVCLKLARYFFQQGNDVTVFYFDDICKVKFPCRTLKIKFSEKFPFDDFDIIHSHMMRPDFYLAKNKKNIHRAKTVSTVHCDIKRDLEFSHGKWLAAIFSRLWIAALKKLDATVQINNFLMEIYKDFPSNRLIYNGVKIDKSGNPEYLPIIKKIGEFRAKNLTILCSYSVIEKRKGLEQILKLLEQDESFAYICIGSGTYKQKLVEYAYGRNLQNRTAFFEAVKRPYNILPYTDCFIFPSRSEGQGLALLEAGFMNASCVCSDIPAFRIFSAKEINFFKLDDIKSLKQAVETAINDKNFFCANLAIRVENDFTEEKMSANYEKLYGDLIMIQGKK